MLWIKMFYWMRLFKSTAHFVTLIFETIYDIKVFLIMLFIILSGFTNFFYIINKNAEDYNISHPDDPKIDYVSHHTDNEFVNSALQVYMLAMGEFYFESFYGSPDMTILWVMWLLGSFILLIVFMNMLIAIMGETFGRVQEIQE